MSIKNLPYVLILTKIKNLICNVNISFRTTDLKRNFLRSVSLFTLRHKYFVLIGTLLTIPTNYLGTPLK